MICDRPAHYPPLQQVRSHALRVPVVLHLASCAALAGRSTGPSLTTALAVLLDHACRAGRSGNRGRSAIGRRGNDRGLECAGSRKAGDGGVVTTRGSGCARTGGDDGGGARGDCARGGRCGAVGRGLRSDRGGSIGTAAAGDWASWRSVVGGVKAVVEVGDIDVGILGRVCARKLDRRAARAFLASSSDLELRTADVELGPVQSLGGVKSEHLGTEKVLAAGKSSGKLELVRHVVGLHDLVGPFAVNVVELIDLKP